MDDNDDYTEWNIDGRVIKEVIPPNAEDYLWEPEEILKPRVAVPNFLKRGSPNGEIEGEDYIIC